MELQTFLTSLQKGRSELSRSISLYLASGIVIDILEVENDKSIKVLIQQKELKNGLILNQKQLIERCKKVFEPTGLSIKVVPVVYSFNTDVVTVEWIENKMHEYGIKRNDLIGQLALSKSYLSRLFSKDSSPSSVSLSKPMKALFFYYFLTYQLNNDLR